MFLLLCSLHVVSQPLMPGFDKEEYEQRMYPYTKCWKVRRIKRNVTTGPTIVLIPDSGHI